MPDLPDTRCPLKVYDTSRAFAIARNPVLLDVTIPAISADCHCRIVLQHRGGGSRACAANGCVDWRPHQSCLEEPRRYISLPRAFQARISRWSCGPSRSALSCSTMPYRRTLRTLSCERSASHLSTTLGTDHMALFLLSLQGLSLATTLSPSRWCACNCCERCNASEPQRYYKTLRSRRSGEVE